MSVPQALASVVFANLSDRWAPISTMSIASIAVRASSTGTAHVNIQRPRVRAAVVEMVAACEGDAVGARVAAALDAYDPVRHIGVYFTFAQYRALALPSGAGWVLLTFTAGEG